MAGAPISVLLCSMPAEGHVRPMAAVSRVLVARGWRVRFLTGSAYEALVVATGAEFLALPSEDRLDELEHDPTAKALRGLNEGVAKAFFDPAPAAWAGIQAALAAEPVDAVLHETTFVGAAGLTSIPVERRPLTVMCGILPLGISSRDTAPFGLGLAPVEGPLRALGPWRNRLLTTLATRVLLRPVHRQADAVLETLGAAPLNGRFFVDLLADEDVLAQFTVPEFEYPRSDAPSALHFFGPTSQLSASDRPLPDWWDRLDGSRPVVHVSQGTVANADFTELVLPTVAALAGSDVTVVVATGGPPVSVLGPLPGNVLAAEFIPYDQLLPRTDVFVTNGGYGGLHYAMEHGVPVVVAGDTEDKVETSARVAWSGIGLNLRTGRPRSSVIAKAVQTVLTDRRYARRSAEIGESIRTSPGVDGLAALLETMIAQRRS